MTSVLAGPVPETCRWFVVKTQPRKEALADLHLRRQAFEAYLPLIPASKARPRSAAAKPSTPRAPTPALIPFFPGYLFVRLNTARDQWRSINGTIGVSKLVQFGDGPTPAPVGLVEQLIARTAGDGVLGFDDPLPPGAEVRIVGGAFDGLIGVMQSQDAFGRVMVLMNVMSRSVPIVLSRHAVVRAA